MLYRTGATCPRCKADFAPAPKGKAVCAGCGGVWLDEGTLRALWNGVEGRKRDLPALVARKDRDRVLPCAVCHLGMEKVLVDSISIDRCAEHGLWFDRHELEATLSSALLDVYHTVDFPND